MFGDETITREILGHVPGWLAMLFYVLAELSCAGAAWGFWRRVRAYRQSRPANVRVQAVASSWKTRVSRVLRYLVFHEQLRRDPFAGWSHLLVTHGFFVLFVGTTLVFLEHDTPLHFYYGWFYQAASLVIDLGGLAFVVGLSMFLARRMTGGSRRILREWWVTALSGLLLLIGVSGFLLEAARIANDLPQHEWCSVIGYPLALGLRAVGISGAAAVSMQQWLWGGHAVVCIAFFALLPWGFFNHLAYGAASVANRTERRLSHLPVTPLVPDQAPGAVSWRQFTAFDLLQSDACTTCGRCNEVCPAAASGKPLRPRDVVLELRRNQDQPVTEKLSENWEGEAPAEPRTAGKHGLAGASPSRNPSNRIASEFAAQPLQLADNVLWACTTCAACNQACPVGIDVYDKIVELRRGRVESGQVPVAAEEVFESVADRGNPFGKPDSERLLWARGLDVPVANADEPIDVLYWVGCSGSFSPEGQTVARSMVKILNHLGVNYRVLGTAERCTGDPARRLGEEGLFRQCAAHNLHELKSHGVKHVITHCPHCYNTMQNEYPETTTDSVGFRTQHHTEFLAEQIAAGKLTQSARLSESVTFHDPCYLARGNGVVSEPRQILEGLNLPIIEMPRNGAESFCCGAGGGSMWLDVRGSDRIENQRYAEAASTGAAIVATGCPFCKTMLAAARQSSGQDESSGPRVLDLAELIATAEGL